LIAIKSLRQLYGMSHRFAETTCCSNFISINFGYKKLFIIVWSRSLFTVSAWALHFQKNKCLQLNDLNKHAQASVCFVQTQFLRIIHYTANYFSVRRLYEPKKSRILRNAFFYRTRISVISFKIWTPCFTMYCSITKIIMPYRWQRWNTIIKNVAHGKHSFKTFDTYYSVNSV